MLLLDDRSIIHQENKAIWNLENTNIASKDIKQNLT